MLYKALFIDIDGTLRDEARGVPASAARALGACRAKGCQVFLCTGRPPGVIPPDVAVMEWDGMIAGGGSYIECGGSCLKNESFSLEGTENALRFLREQENAAFAFETERTVYLNRPASEILRNMNRKKWAALSEQNRTKMEAANLIPAAENLADFRPGTTPATKICLWGEEAVFQELLDLLEKEPPRICQENADQETRYWEIIKEGCDKGDAIRFLCSKLQIPKESVIAFGDGKNDIGMLRAAGTAVAVENADKALLPYAHSVCEAPMKDGIYHELRRRKLISEDFWS